MKRISSVLILIAAAMLIGCGGGGGPKKGGTPSTPTPPPDEAVDTGDDTGEFPADKATASITGKILFNGDPPPRAEIAAETIEASKDKCCTQHHKDEPLLSEDLIVGEDKAIRNVLVHVKSFPKEWKHEAPEETVTIDQVKCSYTPHVVGIMVGQPMVVTSSDDTTHNVHFMAKKNRIRDANQTIAKGQKKEVTFKRPELGSSYFKCDIHGWMKSWIGIFDHPFFVVTGDDGAFDLGKLPPGDYEIEAWHETLGTQQQKVTLKDGETVTLDLTFEPK